SKPEKIRNKIVDGRVKKTLQTKVLVEQPYIRNPNITVNDYIKQVIGVLGENIKVRRFIRYVLGELNS
ncbi:MAG: elongation factor Ts, partial [Acidimicrobiales bacterium]